MMRNSLAALALSVLVFPAAVVFPGVSAAQELSDQALLNLFIAQRDAFKAAQSSGTGKTRGLTLVTVEDVDVTTETAGLAAPATADPGATSATTETGVVVATAPQGPATPDSDTVTIATDAPAAPTTPAEPTDQVVVAAAEATPKAPVVFGDLAPEMQVNVRIEFDFDSAALTPTQKPKLTQLCNVMKSADINLFRIVGHTDASGSDAYNEKLSLLRAQEVQRYFINDCGIAANRLEAVGLGKRFLQDGIDPKSAENRRVEFQALS